MNMKAKDASLVAKIIGGVVIIAGSCLKWFGIMPNAEINEICLVGVTIMSLFATVDLNIMFDKFTVKKEEKIND